MNGSPSLLDSLFAFLNKSKLLLLVIALGLLVIFLVFFTSSRSPQNNSQSHRVTPTTIVSPTTAILPTTTTPVNLYNPGITWSPTRFSGNTVQGGGFKKTVLPDGSTKYSYPSTDINRPNEIIVKDGIVIYQRAVVSDKYIYNYTGSLDAPDYVFQGSKYYGPNTMVYVYLNSGTAFVADSNTTIVKEQLTFQPTNLEDFKKKYAEDVVDFTVIPTLPEE